MKILNYPHFTITVNQHAILTGDIDSKSAQLFVYPDNLEVDILNHEYFNSVDDSATRYELVVEYENDSFYDIWTMDLKVTDIECNDFTVVKNDDFLKLQQFISKLDLHSKLNNDLQPKSLKTITSKKI